MFRANPTKMVAERLAAVLLVEISANPVTSCRVRLTAGELVCSITVQSAGGRSERAECRAVLLAVLRCAGRPQTRKELVKSLKEAVLDHGAGTVAKALADLTASGELVNLRAGGWEAGYTFLREQRSRRKQLLAYCACCRVLWDDVTLECNRNALEASEEFADWNYPEADLIGLWQQTRFEPVVYSHWMIAAAGPAENFLSTLGPRSDAEEEAAEAHQREFERRGGWRVLYEPRYLDILFDVFGDTFNRAVYHPAWGTSTVVSLARAIYAERAFDRLPVLADALEEAGCTNVKFLAHCHGPGTHVRGCWVIDLLLGKR